VTEITNAGYQTIRDFIQSNWSYVEIRNSSGAAIIRISTSDSRCSWIHAPGDQVLKLQVIITGSDSDITLPITIAGAAMYDVASGGNALAEGTFTAATLEADADQVKVEIDIQVPQVV